MDRWRHIDELFEQARALEACRRSEFLRERCGDDSILRDRVEQLLRLDASADAGFLGSPVAESALLRGLSETSGPDPLIGQRVAGFTIKSAVARGGMGTVYLAEQERPRREVALKVLTTGFWTPSIERRFEVESRILAHMRHPNIAQVHEAGTHRSETGATLHYFAMEYVPNARTIIKYANEQSLSLNERLGLFLQLCDAVAYGHQKGIIHRDLKPANILVGTEGPRGQGVKGDEAAQPAPQASSLKSQALLKVIDFGIARATDSDIAVTTMHTEAGQILGTLAYMSPEQCAADPSQIDTATDVYSLGVILYELLTGRMPYDVSNMTIHTAARVICEHEPARPSAFNRKLRGDVETIILKAIEKVAAKRYPSVAALAKDVRQFIRGDPISTRPPTAYSKMLRWAARHPAKTTVALCFGVGALALFLSTFIVWYVNFVPHSLERYQGAKRLDDDSQGSFNEVRLAARNGNTIKTWKGPDRSFAGAIMVDRHPSFGDSQLVVIGRNAADSGKYSGSLCAYEVDGDLENPKWWSRIGESDLPNDESTQGKERRNFGVTYLQKMDVFPDMVSPGEEIFAVFGHSYSRRALRIYDQSGNILYQAWHNGTIADFRWKAGPQLLLCIGSDDSLDNRGGANEYKHVIFALRPIVDCVSNGYISSAANDVRLRPVWYRYLLPLSDESLKYFVRLGPPSTGGFDPETHDAVMIGITKAGSFQVDPEVESAAAVFSVIINSNGHIVESAQQESDSYLANKDVHNLPKMSEFRLSDTLPADSWESGGRK